MATPDGESESGTYPLPVEGLRLLQAWATDIGEIRDHNEDALGFFPPTDPDGWYLAIVADGVGGSNAGEVASRLAVDTIGQAFLAAGVHDDAGETLRQIMQQANDVIVSEGGSTPEQAGMCTTCTCAAIRGNTLVLGHLGDCEAFMVSTDEIIKLTTDHSLAEEYVQSGRELTDDQAHLSHVLTRWLGSVEPVKVDVSATLPFADEHTLVICSDGVTKVVTTEAIQRTAARYLPETACRRLVQAAKDEGGPDNISVQIVRLTRS